MRHPLTLLTDAVPAIRLEPDHTCLILQDIHNPFTDDDAGWLARTATEKVVRREFDEYFAMLKVVAPNFMRLANACRHVGILPVYISLGMPLNGHLSRFQDALGWVWEVDGPDWGFPAAWRPTDRDHNFIKQGWGALSSAGFNGYLREHAIHSAIVAGTFYDYGIRQTCYELTERGIGNLVASDAVAALTEAGKTHTSANIAHGLTKLRTTAEILDLLNVVEDEGHVLV